MATVYPFPPNDDHRHDDVTREINGRAALRELIDALQILALTQPAALNAIAKYARFVINLR